MVAQWESDRLKFGRSLVRIQVVTLYLFLFVPCLLCRHSFVVNRLGRWFKSRWWRIFLLCLLERIRSMFLRRTEKFHHRSFGQEISMGEDF